MTRVHENVPEYKNHSDEIKACREVYEWTVKFVSDCAAAETKKLEAKKEASRKKFEAKVVEAQRKKLNDKPAAKQVPVPVPITAAANTLPVAPASPASPATEVVVAVDTKAIESAKAITAKVEAEIAPVPLSPNPILVSDSDSESDSDLELATSDADAADSKNDGNDDDDDEKDEDDEEETQVCDECGDVPEDGNVCDVCERFVCERHYNFRSETCKVCVINSSEAVYSDAPARPARLSKDSEVTLINAKSDNDDDAIPDSQDVPMSDTLPQAIPASPVAASVKANPVLPVSPIAPVPALALVKKKVVLSSVDSP